MRQDLRLLLKVLRSNLELIKNKHMEKLITTQIKDQLPAAAYWENEPGNFYSSVAHCNYLNNLKVPGVADIPQSVIDQIAGLEEVVPELIPVNYDSYNEALSNASYQYQFGEEAFYHPTEEVWVAKQLTFEGTGINSNNITGWTRRFNGMTCNNISAPMTEFGMLIHNLEVTSDDGSKVNRSLMIVHYDPEGGDGVVAATITLNKFNNQFGSSNNMKLYIPGGRRVAFWLNAGTNSANFVYPQIRISYRRVLSND